MSEFFRYYSRQAQRGGGGTEGGAPLNQEFGQLYKGGFTRGQKGRGVLTNALRGLWDWVSPLFTSGAQALGKEALNTGAKILTDTASSGNLKEAAKQRLTESRDTLAKRMTGGGKLRRKRKRTHRTGGTAKRRKVMRTKGDIFQ